MPSEAIIQFIISPLLVAGVGYIITILKSSKKTGDANARGTMLLLRRELVRSHKKHCIRGEDMTPFDFEDIEEIHETYKELGGNGLVDKMFDELEELRLDKPQKINASER